MNILEKIVADKKIEVAGRKKLTSYSDLEKSEIFNAARPSFYKALVKKEPSVIAEFKRKSPSKGVINLHADPSEVMKGYELSGASAGSVLTDRNFAGEDVDLIAAFNSCNIPLLRKDFIVDEFQIVEARSIGASAILLIAAVLSIEEIKHFTDFAHRLNMDVLYEIHDSNELEKYDQEIKIVGVNNRDLNTFKVDTERSIKLLEFIPSECIKVSESGINNPETIIKLYAAGFDAFLVGENFMKTENPGNAAKDFINSLIKEYDN